MAPLIRYVANRDGEGAVVRTLLTNVNDSVRD